MDIVSVNLNNKAHDVTVAQQRARLASLSRAHPALDVIVTQEARSSRLIIPVGWRALPVMGPGAHEDRIIVRKRLKLTGGGAIRMHEGEAHQWPARWLPFIALPFDGRQLFIVDVHLNSSIEAGGKFAAIGPRARTTLDHIDGVARFASMVQGLGHQLVVLGDTNVDAYADQRVTDPRLPFVRWCLTGPKLKEGLPPGHHGTLGSRRVDRAFVSRGLSVSIRDLKRTTPYDHQPIHVRVS